MLYSLQIIESLVNGYKETTEPGLTYYFTESQKETMVVDQENFPSLPPAVEVVPPPQD